MPEDLQYAVLHEFVEPARSNLPRGTWDYLIAPVSQVPPFPISDSIPRERR